MSTPALSWDAILNMANVEPELILDADMYLFFKNGMREGVSHMSQIYSKVSKKYLTLYDPKQELHHLLYLDTNNLYGYAMSEVLPTGRFKWIDHNEFDVNKYTCNSSKGCALKVNLEYPKEFKELHNDYH